MESLSEEQLCIIGLCGTEGVGAASIARLREEARDRNRPLHAVAGLPAAKLEEELGLCRSAAAAVASVESPRLKGRVLRERLATAGGLALLQDDPRYPDRILRFMGAEAPPVLFLAGNLTLLEEPSVGIVGSRRPSGTARTAADRLAREQADVGMTIVSGGARGIDRTAHRAALKAGSTVLLAPTGLLRFRWRGLKRPGDAEGHWCLVSPFPPLSGWKAAHALQRNRLIVALSDAVVAFEPRDTGGTWNSCSHALDMRKPLFVASATRQGARGRGLGCLVRRGAVALDPAQMPDAAAFARLVATYRPAPAATQEDLFPAGTGDAPMPPAGD